MRLSDPAAGVTLDADFAAASAGGFSQLGPRHYAVDLARENFDPAYPVVWEYMFCFRVRSHRNAAQTLTFRVLPGRGGLKWLGGPHWVKRNHRWRMLPVDSVRPTDAFVEVAVPVGPGEEVLVGNRPFPTPAEVEADSAAAAQALAFLRVKELGRSPENRPILALETEPRARTVLVMDTMQSAEPGHVPVLAVAHWLGSRSAEADELLRDFQFLFLPLANPDGAAHGLSVTNALGEVPRCRFGDAAAGRPAPRETQLVWDYVQASRPVASVEFHWHYPAQQRHGVVGVQTDSMRRGMKDRWLVWERAGIVTSHLATLSRHWQVHLMDPEAAADVDGATQDWRGNLMQVLVRQFGTYAYVYQNAAPTIESASGHAVDVVRAIMRGVRKADAVTMA